MDFTPDSGVPSGRRSGEEAPPSVDVAEASGDDLDSLLGDMAEAIMPDRPSESHGPATRTMTGNDVPQLSDAEFDGARSRPASLPPQSGASAGVSFDDLARQDALARLSNIRDLPPDIAAVSTAMLQNLTTILVDGLWIGNEATLRETMILALIAIDRTTYTPMRPGLETAPLEDLMDAFLVELKERQLPCYQKLHDGRPRRITRPPPLPPVIREKPPAPPRPGRRR